MSATAVSAGQDESKQHQRSNDIAERTSLATLVSGRLARRCYIFGFNKTHVLQLWLTFWFNCVVCCTSVLAVCPVILQRNNYTTLLICCFVSKHITRFKTQRALCWVLLHVEAYK